MQKNKKTSVNQDFTLGGVVIKPGERHKVNLGVARLYDFTEMKMPVEVVRGKKEGPVLFISAAIHGDEINGVEIIRRLLNHSALEVIHGTLIAVPIVNVFGFNERSRYLPDRRDLNRCFPGSEHGSMGSQLAHIFMEEIVAKSTHGIDLHTGAFHRHNLMQIRGNIEDVETMRLAKAFGAPVIINASLRDGSLREAAAAQKLPMLLYEAGEALRFHEEPILMGIQGILRVMGQIGMLPAGATPPANKNKVFIARSTRWVRAPHGGIFLAQKKLGDNVKKGEVLGHISSPFGDHFTAIEADNSGIIIGMSYLPLSNEGDALFHVASGSGKGISTDFPEMVDPVNWKV
jgi:predicted deacylase